MPGNETWENLICISVFLYSCIPGSYTRPRSYHLPFQGEPGLPGRPGAPGDLGRQGPTGPAGPAGEIGGEGLQGNKGFEGKAKEPNSFTKAIS